MSFLSSGSALPVAMDVMENKLKFDGRITRLIFPYGLLINGDGNTIYTALTLIHLARNNLTALMGLQIFALSIGYTLHCPYAFPYERTVVTILMCKAIGIDYTTAYPAIISAEVFAS